MTAHARPYALLSDARPALIGFSADGPFPMPRAGSYLEDVIAVQCSPDYTETLANSPDNTT